MTKIKNIFSACLLLAILALIVAPWHQLAETALHVAAARYGYPEAQFTLESLSARHLALRQVSLSKEVPVTFDRLLFTFSAEELRDGRLTIANAEAQWEGGTLTTKDAELSWNGPELLVANIVVTQVPLNRLMQLFSGGRATATGKVSGALPVIVYADRTLAVHQGILKAAGKGSITVSPELIPVDNPQVGLVRDVLKDFHYTLFSMDVTSGKDKKLSMFLQLHGNNPEVYNGRQVNLNIRLGGDVLSLIEQSVMPMTDPKLLMRENADE